MGRIITLSTAILIMVGGMGVGLAQTGSQGNCQAFDASIVRTQDALHAGVENLNAAIDAANEAYTHLPNEISAKFVNTGSDVIAIVGGENGQRFHLTPQQFDQFFDIRRGGQFDAMSARGGVMLAIREVTSTAKVGTLRPGQYEQIRSQVQAVGKQNVVLPQSAGSRQDVTRETRKYRPPLTPQQIAHPSNYHEQYLVALSAYDDDLVTIAQVRFSSNNRRLAWLEKAQQQRDANNINRTKPLIYPTR